MEVKTTPPRNTRKMDRKPSRTPGKSKADSCQTDPTKKFFATSPKAYKNGNYPEWHDKFKRMNTSKMSGK